MKAKGAKNMEIKEWRSLAVQSISLFLVVLVCCIIFAERIQEKPGDTVLAVEKKQEQQDKKEVEVSRKEEIQRVENATKNQVEERSDTYIRVPKTENIKFAKVSIYNEYMESKIRMTFQGVASGSVTKDSIIRIHGFEVKKGPAAKKEFILKKLVINDRKDTQAEKNVINVEMVTKKLYEPVLFEAEDAYYISLAEPKEIFDSIVVIDAGHGGMDEGTSSRNGLYMEKEYTLLVARQLQKLLEKEDIKVYYTRLEDKEVSKEARAELANSLQADLLISIHCNASSVGDTTAHGVETLYSKRRTNQKLMTNKRLAQIMLKQFENATGLRNRGTILREELFILNHAEVPTTIVEIGYMSNQEDLKFIRKESGQQKIALGIRDGILQALKEETMAGQ